MIKERYTEQQIKQAKDLYFAYTPLKQICVTTGFKYESLKHYISTYWKEERELAKHDIIDSFTESKRAVILSISKHGLELLDRGLTDLLKSGRPLKTYEISQIATLVTELDKIIKLDDGRPTEILAELKPASFIEIKKLLQKDPFLSLEIEDAKICDSPSSTTDPSPVNNESVVERHSDVDSRE